MAKGHSKTVCRLHPDRVVHRDRVSCLRSPGACGWLVLQAACVRAHKDSCLPQVVTILTLTPICSLVTSLVIAKPQLAIEISKRQSRLSLEPNMILPEGFTDANQLNLRGVRTHILCSTSQTPVVLEDYLRPGSESQIQREHGPLAAAQAQHGLFTALCSSLAAQDRSQPNK